MIRNGRIRWIPAAAVLILAAAILSPQIASCEAKAAVQATPSAKTARSAETSKPKGVKAGQDSVAADAESAGRQTAQWLKKSGEAALGFFKGLGEGLSNKNPQK